MPLVERPNCSSTSAHSSRVQPWPPYSGECRPPFRRASTPARLTRSTSSAGRRPWCRSAFCSSGMITSSTKRRARSRSSAWAGLELERQGERLGDRRCLGGQRHLGPLPSPASRPRRARPSERASWLSITSSAIRASRGWRAAASSASARVSAIQRRQLRRRPRSTRRSTRSRSAATAAGEGSPPARIAAIARGSSPSGSGVSESQACRCGSLALHQALRYQLDAFDYKVNHA